LQERVERADQTPIRGDVDGQNIVPCVGQDMAEGRDRAEDRAIAKKNIKLAPALMDCGTEATTRSADGSCNTSSGRPGMAMSPTVAVTSLTMPA